MHQAVGECRYAGYGRCHAAVHNHETDGTAHDALCPGANLRRTNLPASLQNRPNANRQTVTRSTSSTEVMPSSTFCQPSSRRLVMPAASAAA